MDWLSCCGLITILSLFGFCSCTIPDYIHVCKHDDPDLSGCIIKSIEALRPLLKDGIKELEVPALEPLTLTPVSLDTTTPTQASHIAINLTEITVSGASNFNILKLTPTITKTGQTFRFEVNCPKLHVTGKYEVDSKILFVNLLGNGPFNVNITDYHFDCILKGHRIQKGGANHLEFEKMKCTLEIGASSIEIGNLFNGNQVLGRATNDVLNDNSKQLFDEIRPVLSSTVASKFTEIANKITLRFSYEELFP